MKTSSNTDTQYTRTRYISLILLLVFITSIISSCGDNTKGRGAPLINGNIQGIHDRIAYYSEGNIYVINGDGSNFADLTPMHGGAWPSWSPDGRRIAFVSGLDSGSFENAHIYVMNPDGSQITQLNIAGTAPFWSPDGKTIAYTPAQVNNDDIYVMDANGASPRQLTTEGGYEVVWSPSGQDIAYQCAGQICILNISNSHSEQLTTQGGRTPAWSPDGSKIAFVSRDNIYIMNTDGSSTTQLTHTKGVYNYPIWSPDGTRIAFVGRMSSWLDFDRQLGYGIFVMRMDGSQLTGLTDSQIVEPTGRPAWSPDGSAIAFTAWPGGKRGGITDIYVVKTDGSAMARLVKDGERPAWQPRSILTPS